jgi:protein phosphatase
LNKDIIDDRPSLPWQGVGLTDQGMVRATNQDCFAVDNRVGLWIIADGMGGHAGGETASQLAVEAVKDHIYSSSGIRSQPHEAGRQAEALLTSAIEAADSLVRSAAAATPALTGMGTTMVVGLFGLNPQPAIAIAHIGDSRAYLIRNQQIQALTADHSLVQRLIAEGRISAEEARTHPQQNVLLRAVGAENELPAEVTTHLLDPSDMLLLCTDGLTKMIEDEEMLRIILEYRAHSAEACRRLIQLANDRGGKDNTTVVLIAPDFNGAS